jgi:hypothetical protein
MDYSVITSECSPINSAKISRSQLNLLNCNSFKSVQSLHVVRIADMEDYQVRERHFD